MIMRPKRGAQCTRILVLEMRTMDLIYLMECETFDSNSVASEHIHSAGPPSSIHAACKRKWLINTKDFQWIFFCQAMHTTTVATQFMAQNPNSWR